MIHRKLNKKYSLCIRFRGELPYYSFWLKKSNVVDKNCNSLGYSIGIHFYFFHLSVDVDPF